MAIDLGEWGYAGTEWQRGELAMDAKNYLQDRYHQPAPFAKDARMSSLKQRLWKEYGTYEHPAEWDGSVYGGGKVSQRFWEYLIGIEYLDGSHIDELVDIGGGNRDKHFYARVLAPVASKVHVVDLEVQHDGFKRDGADVIYFHKAKKTAMWFRDWLHGHPHVTTAVSISAFEHMPDEIKVAHCKAINEAEHVNLFALTFEFHPVPAIVQKMFYPDIVHTQSLDMMVRALNNFYLDRMDSSPVQCVNTMSVLTPWTKWYPLALKFVRWR